MVATYLANMKKVDFLCADRSFSSIIDVADITFGSFCKNLFLLLCDWNQNSSLYYFNANTYKVLINDPKDEIIPVLGSLYYGVLKQYILKQGNHGKYNFLSINNLEKKNQIIRVSKFFLEPIISR